MKDNPIITIWSLFLAPVIAGIVFDIYNNGYTTKFTIVLILIGIIYVLVIALLTVLDLIRKSIDIRYQKSLAEVDNDNLKLQIDKLEKENQYIIDIGNEAVKTEIIRRVSDLDYHLRLYAINTINLSEDQKVKNRESLKLIEDGIKTQREFLNTVKFDYKKFVRKYIYSDKSEEEEPSPPPSPSSS